MSTSAKILVFDDRDGASSSPAYAIDRTYDGYVSSAGADLLRALFLESNRDEGYYSAASGHNPIHSLTSRLVSVKEDHVLCPLDQWRAYEYVYKFRVREEETRIVVYKRGKTERWNSPDDVQGGDIRTPSYMQECVNRRREEDNGRILLQRLRTDGEGRTVPFRPYIDAGGREMENRAVPQVAEDVATWINPDTGELAGRSLIAKSPRVTVNGHNEPNPTELAARDGVRVEVDFGGQQAVDDDGNIYSLSSEQLQEIAKEYDRIERCTA